MATPACESRSRSRLRARVSTPRDASATIKADIACTARVVARASRASLCVPRPRSEIREKRVVVVRFRRSHISRDFLQLGRVVVG
jgi:hypothetical protein